MEENEFIGIKPEVLSRAREREKENYLNQKSGRRHGEKEHFCAPLEEEVI
jgi:hypothetical protein